MNPAVVLWVLTATFVTPLKSQWFNDADDTHPIRPSLTLSRSSSSHENSATTLNRFFPKSSPAKITAGSRRSGRVTRPSTKAADPDNLMAPKRKGSPTPDADTGLSRRRARRSQHQVFSHVAKKQY
jgi:hypothetical protein